MGMFDEIRVEYSLPDAEVQDHLFQTKDFDNMMETYTITKEGRLLKRASEWEWVDEPGRIIGGYMKEKSFEMVDTNYHGDVFFYTHTGDWNAKTAVEYDYKARFTDGQLQWIKRI